MEGGGKHPPQCYNETKKPSAYRVKRESRTGAVRAQTTTWIRLKKDDELVELAFNIRMMNVYSLSDLNEIVDEMINHMKEQIENPALLNSRFIFNKVLFTNVDFQVLAIFHYQTG